MSSALFFVDHDPSSVAEALRANGLVPKIMQPFRVMRGEGEERIERVRPKSFEHIFIRITLQSIVYSLHRCPSGVVGNLHTC